MERRHFLKLAFGFAAGAAALAAGAEAEAAPLAPQPLARDLQPGNTDTKPAVTTGDEVDRLVPEPVRWGHGRRWGWRRGRRWGWRRRRYWGYRRRWRRRRRYWRRRYW